MADFERTRPIFDLGLAAPERQRAEVVRQACGDDAELEREVLSLLRAESRAGESFELFLGEIVGAALRSAGADEADGLAAAQRNVSRYEIVERVAGGAMGVVYRGRDLRLDRWVALKFLPSSLSTDSAINARLLAEAKAASALDHPNIGVVYEIGEAADGRPFIAMAWYDGETLRERIRRGALPVGEAIAIAKQVGAALAAAHHAGVVHRDVKPANVIVTSSGAVKLLDFGIARRTGSDHDPFSRAGTVAYMSPEQASGSNVDGRSDLWSLGVVLYEMLAGRKPFVGDAVQMLEGIQGGVSAPLNSFGPDVPAGLASVVSKCLEKDPRARFQTAEELCDALGRQAMASDSQAYDLYLKGRSAWRERTRAGLQEAVAYFEGALERDPNFAQAHAALAAVYVNISNFEFMPAETALARAEVSAARALAIDSTLAEARASAGFVLASRGRYDEAEAEFRTAIQLDPRAPWAHHYYALLLIMLGRTQEAEAELRTTLDLDPLSLPASATLGIVAFMRGGTSEAREQFLKTLALAPQFVITLYYYGVFSASQLDHSTAVTVLQRALGLSPGFPGVRAALAYSYRRLDRDGDADRLDRELEAAVTDERSRINLALGYALAGGIDGAFEMLQTARWDVPTLIELRANPLLADFRRDGRYPQLLARCGLH